MIPKKVRRSPRIGDVRKKSEVRQCWVHSSHCNIINSKFLDLFYDLYYTCYFMKDGSPTFDIGISRNVIMYALIIDVHMEYFNYLPYLL